MSTPPLERALREKTAGKYSAGPDTGIFTDGSAQPNPGPGGWGVVHVVKGQVVAERCGHDPDTTNNRMELTALIEGTLLAPPHEPIQLFTDSELCVKSMTQWAHGWAKNGWKKKSGPIANLELVRRLYELLQERPHVRITWIAGHSGWRWNEYADVLATAWTRNAHDGAHS